MPVSGSVSISEWGSGSPVTAASVSAGASRWTVSSATCFVRGRLVGDLALAGRVRNLALAGLVRNLRLLVVHRPAPGRIVAFVSHRVLLNRLSVLSD